MRFCWGGGVFSLQICTGEIIMFMFGAELLAGYSLKETASPKAVKPSLLSSQDANGEGIIRSR